MSESEIEEIDESKVNKKFKIDISFSESKNFFNFFIILNYLILISLPSLSLLSLSSLSLLSPPPKLSSLLLSSLLSSLLPNSFSFKCPIILFIFDYFYV